MVYMQIIGETKALKCGEIIKRKGGIHSEGLVEQEGKRKSPSFEFTLLSDLGTGSAAFLSLSFSICSTNQMAWAK